VAIEKLETVVVGGGQSGLAMSYCLQQQGREHIILERHRIAERWRSERWDSLTFQFPNWAMHLPGHPYQAGDPESFAPKDEVVRYIENYASIIKAPLRCGVAVTTLKQKPGSLRFRLETTEGEIEAANVVIATGPYQKPAILVEMMHAMPAVIHMHSSQYRNPTQLPQGAVLVIGSGNSGCQITEDFLKAGRDVYLAVGTHRRAPRRYRGRDCTWWQFVLGEFDVTTDNRPLKRGARLLTGVDGGHDMDLRCLARDGATLLGHVVAATDGKIRLDSDLAALLARGDEWFEGFLKSADAYADKNGLSLPERDLPVTPLNNPKEVASPILDLDLRASGISAVLWANGFDHDFRWIHLPVFGEAGIRRSKPKHTRGISDVPGIYFLGLAWLSKLKSSLIAGVGEDAAYIADHISTRRV
jgi:putative flavoprotein involved in K+ transport